MTLSIVWGNRLQHQVMRNFLSFLIFALCICAASLHAQPGNLIVADYSTAAEYEIGGIRVEGNQYSDANAIIAIFGVKVGDKIRVPGGEITRGTKALWALKLYTNVEVLREKTIGEMLFLLIKVQERPNLSVYSYKGAKKGAHEDLSKIVDTYLTKGGIVMDGNKANAAAGIEKYYRDKGYLDVNCSVQEIVDTSRANAVRLVFNVERKKRVRIQEIVFEGNVEVKDGKLRRRMDKTRTRKRLFASSKLIRDEYEGDKDKVIRYYNKVGFRDARITGDSIWRGNKGRVHIKLFVNEGPRYHFRNIAWKGNTIYDTTTLNKVLGIYKGDVYNAELLDKRITYAEDGRDISSLYMDNGYLFFSVEPVEISAENDSIDLELRIMEGPLAIIDRVIIKGNDRTHEHVIRRELYTRPGDKFNRSDIIRSQRQIANLGYFNQENLGINTPVNRERGTVDIEYTVEERPSDQLELSAGWGGFGVVGTLGVAFNNFSMRNIFKKESWSPLPQGDGQRLSIRGQSNGRFFRSVNMSFTEPWLGGKKPQSLTVGGAYSRYEQGFLGGNPADAGFFDIVNGYATFASRIKWPDDNFVYNATLDFQNIRLSNWNGNGFFTFPIKDGNFVNLNLQQSLVRSTISDPLYPRSGSKFSILGQFTLPYSKIFFSDRDYSNPELSIQDRYRWLEYHKWRFEAEYYLALDKKQKLVLKAQAKIGLLGYYDKKVGVPPFERFVVGGDGLAAQNVGLTGNDLISLRGYDIADLPASENGGAVAFNKFNVELRYPISLNPSSTIYALAFVSGGNSFARLRDYNPFDIRRSGGLGLRVFLPMFGTLGFDYGIGFDKQNLINTNAPLTKYGTFNIILGFEPE